MKADIVIVGGGLAALNAAAEIREIAPELEVLIIDAGGGASSEIMGFSAPANPPDSPEIMFEDTMRSGGGLSDPALVRLLCNRAMPELWRLEQMGVKFDRLSDGTYDMVHALGTSFPRVVHAGTGTGRDAMRLLAHPVQKNRVVKLLKSGNRIAGVLCEDGTEVRAKAVILAGGGFAGLWKFSSWSKKLRGDCLVLARDAGAELIDLDCVQFEPTVTVFPETLSGFPVITTVLNEGARLLDRHGNSLLSGNLPRKRELAEIIQCAIDEGRACEHGGVRYDFSGVDEAKFQQKYPGYYQKFKTLAPSFADLWFEVKPGAHTTLGGIRIDTHCRTGVPGLFAAGEAAGGIHGRDRLGGNAGLEVLVFGRIAGQNAAEYAQINTFFDPDAGQEPLGFPNTAGYAAIGEFLDRYPACQLEGDTPVHEFVKMLL